MDQQKVSAYLMANQDKFPADKIVFLREKLESMDDSKYALLSTINLKKPGTITVVSIFLGGLGVDRFMLGNTGMGVLKLLTGGCCGVLAIIDWFTVGKKAKEINFNKVMTML